MPYPVNRSPGYGQLGRTIASRFFTGRFGKRDGSTVALSDAPFYRSTAPSSLSPPRISSGRPHSRAENGNCGKSSSDPKEEIDGILSKFQAFEHTADQGPRQKSLSLEKAPPRPPASYAIVTSVRLKGILDRYKAVQMASRPFYDRLVAAGRLHLVDGEKVFTAVRAAYSRAFGAPNV